MFFLRFVACEFLVCCRFRMDPNVFGVVLRRMWPTRRSDDDVTNDASSVVHTPFFKGRSSDLLVVKCNLSRDCLLDEAQGFASLHREDHFYSREGTSPLPARAPVDVNARRVNFSFGMVASFLVYRFNVVGLVRGRVATIGCEPMDFPKDDPSALIE